MDVPKDHYEPSDRSVPETIHDWNYVDCEAVSQVSENGLISYQNRFYLIGSGFAQKAVGLKGTNNEDERTVQFRQFDVKTLNLKEDQLDY